jgi:CobQ-like glutamine amidotransferase family enzyme
LPLAKIIKGFGNNGEDSAEGVLFKNSVGTYLHGPILSKNPHLADYLICKALKLDFLETLDDNLINTSHSASKSYQ